MPTKSFYPFFKRCFQAQIALASIYNPKLSALRILTDVCALRLGDRGQALFGGRLVQWARNPDLDCPASPSLVRGGVRIRRVRSLFKLVLPR
ncbi:unnamed protein product [Pieris brassicae]|uniref:Uncharacterized protein n=1 Tax=Pieris brassicae TaxID=7116 RepID=A0A9P0TU35_PIEBR|nr:unnamed protein product [Pieris brassicae]